MQNHGNADRATGTNPGAGTPDLSEERVTPTEARQGSRGTPVLWVLVSAMLLCGIYLAATMSWTTTKSNDRNPTAPQTTSTGTGTNSAGERSGGTAAGGPTTATPAGDQVRR